VLLHPSALDLSTPHLRFLTDRPAAHRAACGTRWRRLSATKHALPLSERTYTCTACGAVSPRDKNSARVMLVRAGLNPAGVEGVRPPGALLPEAA
jgi:putative transposase